jgi:hypothetical protein
MMVVESAFKEGRFKANENHRISKRIVEKAIDTGRGFGLEDLTDIRTARIHRVQGETGGCSGDPC